MVSLKHENIVHIPIGRLTLEGELIIPTGAKGIVLFAHGSGSSRYSPRNQFVAKFLREHQLATLLIDLLTSEEEKVDMETRELRFDIDLLADRLIGIAQWLLHDARTKKLQIGLFGSSTGAAAALIAAAKMGEGISAVVSRGGRPDLAEDYLNEVKAATLFIVGGDDTVVIEMNEQAFQALNSEKEMSIIPGATHLFEEPGALEEVSRLARDWFEKHFT